MSELASIRRTAVDWMSADPDPQTRDETQRLLEDPEQGDELRRCFGQRLAFGTAGIRGLLGPGPGCMNRLLVQRVTAGLAAYLNRNVPGARSRGVVVAHDARNLSEVFARDTARVLSGAGFRVIQCPPFSPTPLAAFALKHLDAAAAIVVTASHNPPAYNGYKVYWENGAQIVPPHDSGIAQAIDDVEGLPQSDERIEDAPASLEEAYLAAIAEQVAHIEVAPTAGPVRLVYTPMHGVGGTLCERALQGQGVEVVRVDSQWAPDPAFPTVAFPNPEEPGALAEAIAVADREGIDLVLANDPDADRLCVMVRYNGTLRRLTGDELGAILGDALLAACSQERPFVARTIVSSDLLEKVAAYYGARCVETLTGFKWLWNASLAQVANGGAFAFAYEEAIGYSVGSAVRDKDGIGAAILVARLAASGVSVWERLVAIWKRHGAVATRLCSLVDAEPGGLARHAERIRRLRTEEVTHIGGIPVVERRDYKDGSSDLPPANCLAFFLQDGSRIMLRPSGTEPKLKIYLQVVEEWSDSVDGRVSARLKELEEAMVALAMNGESVVE